MLVAFMLFDRAGASALRAETRPAHKAYLAAVADRIAFAGPLLEEVDGDAESMIGSLLVVDFDSLAAARAWLADEPFTRAGVYGRQDVHACRSLWPQRAGIVDAG